MFFLPARPSSVIRVRFAELLDTGSPYQYIAFLQNYALCEGNLMKSYMATPETAQREWFVVDAEGKTLGRLASKIAMILRGKNKPTFTPHVDMGDFVVVVNADKVHLTGRKLDQKMYWWHTGYPGGIKGRSARKMLERNPEHLITAAVKGMLPKTVLGRGMLKKLKVYAQPEHPHEAQQPKALEV